MPDLHLAVESAEAPRFAAVPQLVFKLRITNRDADELIHAVMLRCQIRLEVTRRRYDDAEKERLFELFGEPERWSQTLHSMLWTHANVTAPPFAGSTIVDVPVPCTYDFNVAATKYMYALHDGEMPLLFLFSGTVFYAGDDGALQVAQISWEKEAAFKLPVQTWQAMIERNFPNSAWLYLRRDVFDRLYRYKMQHALPTWEQALERLLAVEDAQVSA